ncbi:MAG TPA: flagellar biosynthetic protein FliR [Solirubrobacteraceae bacterium]|nr:flagellar biosynthetic protein FliR [Solirubrobacteraceae bacterium]
MTQLLVQIGPQRVAGFFLVLARVSPLFAIAPLFSSKMVPLRVRGVIAVALAFGLSPVVTKGHRIDTGAFPLAGLIGKELLVGLAFAYALAALFAAITVAGSLLDTLIGFSFSSLVDPVTGNQSSVLANLYALVAVLIFIGIGGDAWVIEGLARTYDVVPVSGFPALGPLVAGANVVFVKVFSSALQVAAPVLLAVLVTDAGFGMVSRVVPQLNVFQVGFPSKVLVGLLLIGVSLPFVGGWLANELQTDVGLALHSLRVAG